MIAKNNPFNIRYNKFNKWLGLTGANKGFCEFATMDYGLCAGIKLLLNYVYKKDCWSVQAIVSRYAPPNENNTRNYIRNVSVALRQQGIDPDDLRTGCTLVNDYKFFHLCKNILKMETGYVFTLVDYIRVVDTFGLKKSLYGKQEF